VTKDEDYNEDEELEYLLDTSLYDDLIMEE